MFRISDEKLQRRIGFEPFEAQRKIINSNARHKIVVCGRRFGKTSVAAYLALKKLLEPETTTWVVAPSYDLTRKVFDKVVFWLAKVLPKEHYKVKNKPYPEIRTSGNSILQGKSAENPISLLGEELDFLVVDEAAEIDKDIWYRYLFPTTHDRNAKTIFISTPRGRNWLYHRWLEEHNYSGATFQFPSNARPNFPEAEWKKAQEVLDKDLFAEQYLAQFVDAASSVFKVDDIKRITNKNALEDPIEGESYVMGVDLAKKEDRTIITVAKRSANRIVYIEKHNQEYYPFQKRRIITVARRYNNAEVLVDSTGVGEPIFDDLFDAGLLVEDFRFSNQSKNNLINKLRIFITEGHLTIPDDEELRQELLSINKTLTPNLSIRYSAPKGSRDDMVWSLALAVWGLDAKPRKEKSLLAKELEKARIVRAESFI